MHIVLRQHVCCDLTSVFCRFTNDIGRGKDMGDQHEASALRDEVWLSYHIQNFLTYHTQINC